jgi:hypothetical protein
MEERSLSANSQTTNVPPTFRLERFYISPLALGIRVQLGFPELQTQLRKPSQFAVRIGMTMPESTGYENHHTARAKCQIEFSQQILAMQPLTNA